jgi:NADH:ubiquinone oxidoreductase subunit K
MSVGLLHYLILSGVLFSIGLYGVLAKRNVVVILMCIEIMLNATNIALVAFSRYITPTLLTGQIFAVFVIVVAAAEVAVGIAIIFAIYRSRKSVDINNFDLMKW